MGVLSLTWVGNYPGLVINVNRYQVSIYLLVIEHMVTYDKLWLHMVKYGYIW